MVSDAFAAFLFETFSTTVYAAAAVAGASALVLVIPSILKDLLEKKP